MRLLGPGAGHSAFSLQAGPHLQAPKSTHSMATRTTASTAPWTWPHTSLPVTTHSQRSHRSGPSHHMQPPPRCPRTGPTAMARCPAFASRSKQAGNEGESQTASTDQSVARGNTGQHVTPLPPGWPPAPETWVLTWQVGKVSWCCSNWPTAKSRTLASLAWCRRNRVRSSESSSSCRCVDTSRGN